MFIKNFGVDLQALTSMILNNLNENAMPYQMQDLELDTQKIMFDSSALLTFKSFESLRTFNKKLILTNEFFKPLQLILFCQNASVLDLKLLSVDVERKAKEQKQSKLVIDELARLNTQIKDNIQYEYFIVEEEEFVKLLTFVFYSLEKCGEWQLIEVNRFNKTTAMWANDKFSIEKLSNIHGCELVYGLRAKPGSFAYFHMTKYLMPHLNFSLRPWDPSRKNIDLVDIIIEKGCLNNFDQKSKVLGPEGKVIEVESDFIIFPTEYAPVVLAASPAGNYSEYEKLLMPFDDFTWALIALTFLTAFATILILYRVKKETRSLIIGSNITTPSLNITQIFFGIAQGAVPRRNFARFLTMTFILYSLIIRTAWQGKTFEFMQKDIAKPEIQTVEEMIDQGYTFYVEPNFVEMFPELEISKRGKVYFYRYLEDFVMLAKKLMDPKFKGALQTNRYTNALMTGFTKGLFLKRLRKEVLYINTCGIKLDRHHHFTGIFDLKSQQFFATGIAQYIDRNNNEYLNPNRYKHLYIGGPKVLNMQMLEPGFVIWSTSLSFALVAIVMEWLTTLKDFIVFKSVLLAFYCMKHEKSRMATAKIF